MYISEGHRPGVKDAEGRFFVHGAGDRIARGVALGEARRAYPAAVPGDTALVAAGAVRAEERADVPGGAGRDVAGDATREPRRVAPDDVSGKPGGASSATTPEATPGVVPGYTPGFIPSPVLSRQEEVSVGVTPAPTAAQLAGFRRQKAKGGIVCPM